jgi:hypothetical protein
VFGYIGGNALHVWTKEEWSRFDGKKKVPIWVKDGQSAAEQSHGCLSALRNLHVPKGSPVALDMETIVDPAFTRAFGNALANAGYRLWTYGSAGYVFKNPSHNGYWVADYRGTGPFMYQHKDVRATQYVPNVPYENTEVDLSTIKAWQYHVRLRRW